jgi:formylglycine-generating enzyme required for sulfatase activity
MIGTLAFLWIAATGAPPAAGAPKVIQDCVSCPRMIEIAAGEYSIGSPQDEPGRYPNERPMKQERVGSFAIGETEITRGQYAKFVAETNREMSGGCFTPGTLDDLLSDLDPEASWRNPGFEQTDDHPVVCVSWNDAVAYAEWLSAKTGQEYRLPTESRWEVAARGGAATAFFWGRLAEEGCNYHNGGDLSLAEKWPEWAEKMENARKGGYSTAVLVQCKDGHAFTSAAKSLHPNPFGLFDMIGNAWEWVLDCGDNQSSTGNAQLGTSQVCERRRTRGGSWDDWPVDLRSAVRKRLEPSFRRNDTGFRLVREIS